MFAILLAIFIVLISNNANLTQNIMDYTLCKDNAGLNFSVPDAALESGIEKWSYDPSKKLCTIQFKIVADLKPNVHMYIRITNFYQNHQFYVKSQDPGQLRGNMYAQASDIPSASASATNDCGWLLYGNCDVQATKSFRSTKLSYADQNPDCRNNNSKTDPVIVNAAVGSQYYPCGLSANSMFSDEFSDLECITEGDSSPCTLSTYTFTEQGIAWPEDKSLYAKTSWASSPNNLSIQTTLIPPPMWRRAWPDKWGKGYNVSNLPDLATWERFQVWMRKAGLPTFRKLWGINSMETLRKGTWQVSITDTWNASRFGGTKSLVFADIGILGPHSNFLWYAEIQFPFDLTLVFHRGVVLAFSLQCLLFAVIIAVWNPRESGNLNHLSWKKEQ